MKQWKNSIKFQSYNCTQYIVCNLGLVHEEHCMELHLLQV